MAHRDKEGWDAILLATVWAIWLGKNKMMFQQKEIQIQIFWTHYKFKHENGLGSEGRDVYNFCHHGF